MELELPAAVRRLTDAVSEKLGRPAHCRKVKNRDEWYVYDPVFSFIQRGMKKGETGYRVGYNYRLDTRSVSFVLVHSPVVAKLFKRNLALPTMIEVLRSTADQRDTHYVHWSSKEAVRRKLDRACLTISSSILSDFMRL